MTGSAVPEPAVTASIPGPDRRQRETERLLRLMGGMLGDAYADIGLILAEKPRLATASHLVGHLAREIDSGVRELLTAMLPPVRREYLASLCDKGSRDAPRRQVIAEICDFLGVPAEDEVRTAWVSLAWHKHAHRGALREPRVLDREFLSAWSQFDFVLLEIAKRFEASYLAALPLIDVLAAIASPTKDDLAKLRNQVPQSVVAMRRFYSAAGPGWFPLLRGGGFFRNPSRLRPDEDGMVSYVPWPAGPYLVRMAAEPNHAADVVGVFAELDTDNPEVSESAADVALVVSSTYAAQLATKIAEFLRPFAQWGLPSKAGKVVVRLAAEGQQEAALTIVKALIPIPDRRVAGHRFVPLKQIAPAYADLGIAVVVFLGDLLCAADCDPDNGVDLAYSSTWQPAIGRDRDRDSRGRVLSALRDAATAVARAVGAPLVVRVLDGYGPAVFTRLSLHVLAQVPDPQLVSAKLVSADLFADTEIAHEYTVLLRVGYPLLEPEDQATIAGFVNSKPPWRASSEEAEQWTLSQLARFGDQLPDHLRATYDALAAQYGPPTEDDDPSEFADWPGTHSPVDAAEIATMSDDDLITLLGTWREPGGWRAPTVDGLRNQVQEAAAADPVRFARLSPRFVDLAPSYGAAVLSGLTAVLSADRTSSADDEVPRGDNGQPTHIEPFSWDDVLDFVHAVIDRSRSAAGQPPQLAVVHQPTWQWCQRLVAQLLTEAIRRQRIALGRVEQVLALILELAQDPEPRPGQRTFPGSEDPAAEAFNTVRGLAFMAAIQFLVWIPNHQPDTTLTASHEKITALLDAHLDPVIDASIAVRAVYGMNFGVLATRLVAWVRTNRDRIFGDGDTADLGAVAWQSFLRSNHASAATFELLHDRYRAAVAALAERRTDGEDDDANRAENEAIDRLLGHIAALYGHGQIDLESDIITTMFADQTPAKYRSHILEICGQMLADTPEPSPAMVERFQALWEWRIQELNAGNTQVQEMGVFGWWMSAESLPASWALSNLNALLTAGGCPEPSHMTAKRLADLRKDALADVVRCMALLIDAPTDPWFVDASRDDIAAVLTDGLKADDPQTRRIASETVSRLVARGRTSFAQLVS